MWKFKERRPRCFCHLLVALVILTVVAGSEEIRDFITVNLLPDGEVETRIYYEGVTAKETTVSKGSSSDIKFRQLANNRSLIQLIYDGDDALTDCEIVHQRDQVKEFLLSFKNDLSYLIATSNLTIESLDGKNLPQKVENWFNYTKLKKKCKILHKQLKQAAEETRTHLHDRSSRREKRSMFIVPGTLWCGKSHVASSYTKLGVMSGTDKCCRRHDHCQLDIPGLMNKYYYHNYLPFTISHCSCDKRQKRDISDFLRIPGTKWCGKGYSADKYTRLGGFSRTDKCCRRHDLACPFWIGAFETKYELFNWRVNTIMHCSCDERFRACLKMVDTGDANLVGKLFFNVVQSKCFVLKPRKRCIRMSWWGKCQKYRYEKHAILRDNLPY